jgi:hypothetical protein
MERGQSRTTRSGLSSAVQGAEGSHGGDDIKALFVKQRGCCVYCNVKLGKGYHVDHISLREGGQLAEQPATALRQM